MERFCTLTSAVLIFVSGMNDILTLTELIEDLTGGEITCIPVHGDIPIDDLMDAFETGLGKKVSLRNEDDIIMIYITPWSRSLRFLGLTTQSK